jgi:hypothetical protein
LNNILACEREFVKKEEQGEFLLKSFGGYPVRQTTKEKRVKTRSNLNENEIVKSAHFYAFKTR